MTSVATAAGVSNDQGDTRAGGACQSAKEVLRLLYPTVLYTGGARLPLMQATPTGGRSRRCNDYRPMYFGRWFGVP
eukprot:scaffold1659_cov371-Prasinococcus_capsulatus_cf.AAC.7